MYGNGISMNKTYFWILNFFQIAERGESTYGPRIKEIVEELREKGKIFS